MTYLKCIGRNLFYQGAKMKYNYIYWQEPFLSRGKNDNQDLFVTPLLTSIEYLYHINQICVRLWYWALQLLFTSTSM